MKIKVTAGELTVMVKPLQDLMAAKMPSGAGYQVARLVKKLESEIQIVMTKQSEVMRKYKAEVAEDGSMSMTADNPNFAKAKAELNDLFAQPVTLDADMVTLPKNITLEPSTLLILDKFIKVA